MLTAQQERFCREYVLLDDSTAAYQKAYPKAAPASAGPSASRLLANVKVRERVDELRRETKARHEATADRVILELARMAFADIGDVMDFAGDTLRLRDPSAIPEHARRAIQSVKVRRHTDGRGADAHEVEVVEFKLADKRGPLELLGKRLGLFTDDKAAAPVSLLIDPTNLPPHVLDAALASLRPHSPAVDAVLSGLECGGGPGDAPGEGGGGDSSPVVPDVPPPPAAE